VTETEQQQIFKTWLSQHQALIFKVVRAYAFTGMDRDDLFQEISFQVWRSVPSFRKESSAVTWIYRVALNTAIRWIRKERRHQQQTPIDHAEHLLQENTVTKDERLDWLYEQIHQLEPVDRSISLLMLDGFSYKEMATIIGITESHVGVKINRVKKQLMANSKNTYHEIR
jgi:RNA polymerase sigma-70 factor (ECF subfamily)